MRRQDEIRILYREQAPPSQKFLLAELDRFAKSPDADDVLDLILGELGSADALVRGQALVTATQFLPGYTRRRHGGEVATGEWSEFLAGGSANVAKIRAPVDAQRTAALRLAAQGRLAPLFAELARVAPALPPRTQDLAYAALALLPDAHSLPALALGKTADAVGPLWAWAAGGGARHDPQRLLDVLDRSCAARPQVLLAAQALPAMEAAALARRIAPRVGWSAAADLAIALGRSGAPGAVPLLRTLSLDGNGWTQVYALRAVEMLRPPDGLPFVEELHDRATHEFVRAQAVRSAGAFASEAALGFCQKRLASTEGIVVAQALESLVRLRCPRAELADAARPLTASPDLRVRVNALLATVDPREGKLPDGFLDMLRNPEVSQRLEAAFCLGYWRSRRALEILAVQTTSDPTGTVRVQAVKSVSKYPVTTSLPVLTRVVETAGPVEALTAARLMSRLDAPDPGAVVRVFLSELARHPEPERRALLLTGLAGLMARESDAAAGPVFAAALDVDDPRVQAAALTGLKMLGDAGVEGLAPRLEKLSSSTAPAVASGAAAARFLAGDLAVVAHLTASLAAGDGARREGAVLASLELALLATQVIEPRHAALAAALPVTPDAPAGPVAPPSLAAVPAGGIEEGDFESALSVGAAAAAPAIESERNPVSEVRELSTFFEQMQKPKSRKVARTELGGIQKGTYLVAGAGRGEALESEPLGRRAGRTWRQLTAAVSQNPILLGPPLALLVIAAVVLKSVLAPSAPPRDAAKVALTVVSATGPLTVEGVARPLATGDRARAGDRLKLARGADASLTTESGGEVRLKGPCELKIVSADNRYGLVLDVQKGEIEANSAAGEPLVLTVGRRRISGMAASLRCVVDGDECRVTARAGEVEALTSGGERRMLKLEREETVN
jgi:hypothetical protein